MDESNGQDERGDTACPVETAISSIGGKWKMLIIRATLLEGASRFNELARKLDGISNKVLSENLRALEYDRIIVKDDEGRYGLSPVGSALLPIFKALGEWGQQL